MFFLINRNLKLLLAISLDQLSVDKEGSQVEVRGFLTKDEQGMVYLVERPKIKSCCIGLGKQKEIKVQGLDSIALPSHAVLLSGTLKSEGVELILKDSLIQEEGSIWPLALFPLAVFLLIIAWKRFGRA